MVYSLNKTKAGKIIIAVLGVVLTFAVFVGSTVAFLKTKTDPLTNTFAEAYVTCRVNNNGSTADVTNTSNISAYIRAYIAVNWMDDSGNIRGAAPAPTDYTLSVNTDDWTLEADGFYYYNSDVASNGTTDKLIESVTLNVSAPEGYRLSVEVVADAIQSEGMNASTAQEAWQIAAASRN